MANVRRAHAVCFRCSWQATFPSPSKDKDFELADIQHGIEKPEAIHSFNGKIKPFGGTNEPTP